ncbi:Recombination protein MgsA [Arboricoccus pini]|uniref:Replication-associated recombination protein A n=1 Tax=Arboricoccus pini TaxID=1963835 RepID=A0A212QTP2_9PROT|nr:replication-associated recombination protein A [Arboricoccus pini]SNB62987.1 Recombination protein MgsA [Arboricoccus pini]
MNDLFGAAGVRTGEVPCRLPEASVEGRPLADRLRPRRIEDVVGQDAALGVEAPLGRMLERGRLSSLILWGPPGCGKTTLARLIAQRIGEPMIALSAVMSGVADLRKAFDEARRLRPRGRRPVLFIDEIHRFNRAQQDGLLHEVEDGTVTLIGATTENPSFALNPAVISRCHVVVLQRLDDAAMDILIDRAEAALDRKLPIDDIARSRLTELADGDGRYLLNMIETLADLPSEPLLDSEGLGHLLQRRLPVYDKQQEAHYNLISALHKSVRGSDPDASLYWFCRMIAGGEDPRYIARRLVRMAAEDIGLAEPDALSRAMAAAEAFERLGSPEGELMLAQTVVELALAPKSNAVYLAYKAAMAAARDNGSLMPPLHITNAPTKLMRQQGYGEGYVYDHDAPERFSGQNYFPEALGRQSFYVPTREGKEAAYAERHERLAKLRMDREADAAAQGSSATSPGPTASRPSPTQDNPKAPKPSAK